MQLKRGRPPSESCAGFVFPIRGSDQMSGEERDYVRHSESRSGHRTAIAACRHAHRRLAVAGTVQPAVRFEHVCKVFEGAQGNVTALAHVSLAAAPGEIYGIIGRSGAGKSTLIRCVNLLERPTSGRVIVDGEDVTALDGRASRTWPCRCASQAGAAPG